MNRHAERLAPSATLGEAAALMLGSRMSSLIVVDGDAVLGIVTERYILQAFYQEVWQTINTAGFWRGEVWNRKKSGEIFVEQLPISSVRDRQGEVSNFVGIFPDITVIKAHQ